MTEPALSDSDERFMEAALQEAAAAGRAGDVPVGAVIVSNGEIIGRGRNRRVIDDDPLGHAEVVALRDAAQRVGNWRFDDSTLYCTLEPCAMCAGALAQTRIAEIVFGIRDPKFGGIRSLFQICDDPRSPHRMTIREGVRADECLRLLRGFFQQARSSNR